VEELKLPIEQATAGQGAASTLIRYSTRSRGICNKLPLGSIGHRAAGLLCTSLMVIARQTIKGVDIETMKYDQSLILLPFPCQGSGFKDCCPTCTTVSRAGDSVQGCDLLTNDECITSYRIPVPCACSWVVLHVRGLIYHSLAASMLGM
jgi:hypothetical protein